MNDETKQKINERYQQELQRGEFFWPDSIYKDLIVSFGIFILLVLLATFIGVAPEAKADAADTSYPLKVKEVRVDDRRYVVCVNEEQARKDQADREAIVGRCVSN